MNSDSQWEGKVAVVTGASAGIGAAICHALATSGMKVVGVARRVDRIEEAAKSLPEGASGSLHGVQCDLTKDEEVARMWGEVEGRWGSVSLVVNNAGLSTGTSLLDDGPSEWRAMLDLNVVALCHVTQLAVAHMRRGDIRGHVVHISSMAGHRVPPHSRVHFYTATKHAVAALTEGLRQELREINSPIRISSISPGLVATEFHDKLVGASEAAREKFYSALPHLKPEDVASTLLHIINSPAHVEINDVMMRPRDQVI